jgi:hypothetical protein
MIDSIELRGTMTLGDLKRARHFVTFSSPWMFFFAVFGVIFVRSVFLDVYRSFGIATAAYNAIIYSFFFVVGLGLLLSTCANFVAKRQFKEIAYLHDPVRFTFTPEAVLTEGTGISSKIDWSGVKGMRETKTLFLLRLSSNWLVIIPKHFFQSSDEIDRWLQLVRSCMAGKPIDRPSFVGRWC